MSRQTAIDDPPRQADLSRPIAPIAKTPNPFTVRALLLGLAGVVLICALTPFNNYVLNNTGLVGSYVPLGLIIFFLAFIVCINAPLYRWAPRLAFHRGELTIALAMMLVGCSLPSGGLMRYLPGHLTGLFLSASQNPEHVQLLRSLHLPAWIFPQVESTDAARQGIEPVITQFYQRIPLPKDSGLMAQLKAIPWRAWLVPAASWGVFAAGLFGAVIFLSALFRRQWVETERLAFPLTQIYTSLVETPVQGSAFNNLLRSGIFQVAFAITFAVHGLNALHVYFPQNCPEIPLAFHLAGMAGQPPLSYLSPAMLNQKISLAIVGFTYFVQSDISLSIWVFFLLSQFASALAVSQGTSITEPMQVDQIFGGMIVFGFATLWIARKHLAMVARQMFRPPAEGEARGEYLPYWAVGWGLLLCLGVLVAWLCAAGASLAGACVMVLMLVVIYLVLAKIVAQTGLLYVLLPVPLTRPWIYALSGLGERTTLRSYFFASMFSSVLTRDLREASPVYVTHAMRLTDDVPGASRPRFLGVLALALLVGFIVSGASTLYVHYSYASSLDAQQQTPIDPWATVDMPRQMTLDGTLAYVPPSNGPIESHNRAEHFAIGTGITLALSLLSLRFAAWPLQPVGYLLCYTWSIQLIWASVFLGWLAKQLILHLGGGGMFRTAQKLFIGLILGELSAAGFWLVFSAVRAAMGLDFKAIHILPY